MKLVFRHSCYAVITAGLLIVTGCDSGTTLSGIAGGASVGSNSNDPAHYEMVRANDSFEKPFRLKTTNGKLIAVESPGYACPTFADIDQDGDDDLIVGQFAGGNMQVYRNESEPGATPKFGSVDWITAGEKRAEVPGVS
jgi:hypothetical protein